MVNRRPFTDPGMRWPARIAAKVASNGVPYYLTKLQLNPHETRAIDLRKLRDAQQPDFKNNKIPAGATDGSVLWIRGDNLPVMGRMMQIHRKAGMTSNYDCCFCGCPYNYTPSLNYMNPISLYLWVTSEGGFVFYAGFKDCNQSPYWYDYTTSASWSSGNPSIASMQGAGLVKGVSGGTASISASYSGYTYTFNGSVCIASPPVPGGSSGPTTVYPPTYAVLTGSEAIQGTCIPSPVPGVTRTYAAYDSNYNLLTMSLGWTLHENVTSQSSCGMGTDGTANSPNFADTIYNCQSNCTFTSNQWFSVVLNGYTYTLKAQDGVDPTFTTYPVHTGWHVTATTSGVTVGPN